MTVEQLPAQLSFPVVSDAEAWDTVLDAIRDIVRARSNKEVAFALDIAGSDLSNMLADGRNRTEFKLRHLPILLRLRHNDDLPRALARVAGLELAPVRALTAGERLERLEAALARAGAAGQAISDDAFGRWRSR